MDSRLQRMLDHFEIREVLIQYCRAIDRMDEKEAASVYAANSWDDHGPMKCSGPEFVERVLYGMRNGSSLAGSHHLGQSSIWVKGDQAGAETYFIATNRQKLGDAREVVNHMGGRYVDTLVREEAIWKIRSRVCVHDWSASHAEGPDWVDRNAFTQGERDENDPSYAAMAFGVIGAE